MKKCSVLLFAVLLMMCFGVYADDTDVDANAAANAGSIAVSSPSLTLIQKSAAPEPGAFRSFSELVNLSYPSPIPWFGPVTSSWNLGIDFGGKTEFTMEELKNMRDTRGIKIVFDSPEKVNYRYEKIKLIILEPINKDGKFYVPNVQLKGEGKTRGFVDGTATKKDVLLRKLVFEAMIQGLEKGCNGLVVYNYGGPSEIRAWSIGTAGGGSISELHGENNQIGANGSVSGGTFYGKTKNVALPFFNGVAVEFTDIPKITKAANVLPEQFSKNR